MSFIALLALIIGLSKLFIMFSLNKASFKNICNITDIEPGVVKCLVALEASIEILCALFIFSI